MKVVDIVRLTNKYLSGEQLTYNKLLPFLDAVIDDINSKLNSTYPAFSVACPVDALSENHNLVYNCFPDSYIRSVVCIGAASKFYMMDEEGIVSSEGYEMKYQENLFYMMRDFVDHVPQFYQSDSTGGFHQAEERYVENHLPYDFKIW